MGAWTVMTGAGGSDDGEQPTPEDFQRWNLQREAPDNEVPEALPVSAVLIRDDAVAVVLAAVAAHSSGFALDVSVLARRASSHHDDLWSQITGGGEAALLLGVEFSDGRRGSTLQPRGAWPPRPPAPGEAQDVVVESRGGGGGGRRWDQRYWVSPLPPDGPLRVVARWDGQGLAEAVTQLDGAAVAAAGRRAVELWPWEPEVQEPHLPEEPQRPVDGWFAQL